MKAGSLGHSQASEEGDHSTPKDPRHGVVSFVSFNPRVVTSRFVVLRHRPLFFLFSCSCAFAPRLVTITPPLSEFGSHCEWCWCLEYSIWYHVMCAATAHLSA